MNSVEYTALIIVAALIFLAFMLTTLSTLKQKEAKKTRWKEFDDFVIDNNLAIDKKQHINKNIIGLDRLNHKLVFMDTSKGISEFRLINLQDLHDCRLVKQKNNMNGHISNIFLQCIFRDKGIADIFLPFYNEISDDVYKLMRLSRKAYYWEKSISLFREAAILSEAQ